MEFEQIILIILILGGLIFSVLLDFLNLRNISGVIPKEFEGFYNQTKYKKSQDYLKINTQFSITQNIYSTLFFLLFLMWGGFNFVDELARTYTVNTIYSGLIFFSILALSSQIMNLPFEVIDTFYIEEKFGFNKTTVMTFLLDKVKAFILAVIIGLPILASILWFFETFENAWFYVFVFLTFIQLFLMFIAPVTIMPLFNKFEPLNDGELKTAIQDFAKKENFILSGIFTMDGSKRSTKANAYFTGFGKYRRIVLFDTLIKNHSTEELVAILAHEIGHYKLKHIFRQLGLNILTSFITFFALSVFLNNNFIFSAFGVEQKSVYASLLFFGFFYAPISEVISLYSLYLSRKYEYEADRFAVDSYKKPEMLITALKKLSVENLSNLYPHKLKVVFEYTHPPILDRIEKLRSLKI